MPITPTEKIWMNGELVAWDDARIHILTHSLHYGMGVFEGIRAYPTADGPAVFRLTDHIERLHNSAKIMMMDLPYSVEELVEAVKLTVRETGLDQCYIRPIAYYGYGEMGLNTLPCEVDVAIACWPWGAYLGEDAVTRGVSMKISSWTRHDHNTMPPASKTTGNYVNSSLAKVEALKAGYDEAIMLNPDGLVAECTGENIFVARHGVLITPPLASGALEGITQNSVMTIARDHGYEVRVGELARSDLYIAEEMFVCGTAAEVSAVNSVDDRAIRQDGDVRCAASEVGNGRSVLIVGLDSGAKRGRQTFFHHQHTTDASVFRGAKQRAALDLCDHRIDTHQRPPAEKRNATAGLAHQVGQHRAGPFEVGDDAVDQRSNNVDVARLAPVHLPCLLADGDHFSGDVVDANQRRLIHNDPTPTDGNHGIRRSQVDGD